MTDKRPLATYEETLRYAEEMVAANIRALDESLAEGRRTQASRDKAVSHNQAILDWLRSASLLFGDKPAAGYPFFDVEHGPAVPIDKTLKSAKKVMRARDAALDRDLGRGKIGQEERDEMVRLNGAIVDYLRLISPVQLRGDIVYIFEPPE